MSDEIHVQNIPAKESKAFVAKMAAEDPAFVYYGVFVPHGDTEGGRLRRLGLVQVFKCLRPEKTVEVDKVAAKLVRKG